MLFFEFSKSVKSLILVHVSVHTFNTISSSLHCLN